MSAGAKSGYEPAGVEARWYRFWEQGGFFHADEASPKPPYCIVIPPPNVTGSLHMGHALNNTLQDILIRWKRMQGMNALWMPGTDHAGIATQNVVERQLQAEGVRREDLGRDRFIQRVWEWREQYGRIIITQLKRLGASCDWDREAFTMDEPRKRAVLEVFVRLFEDGLLYRAERLVNWCPRCETALADIEVVHEEEEGFLWYIRYPFADEPTRGLVVATTRPETMLADTAVAVHPEDERYQRFIGRRVILPLVGRQLPVIADPYVSREFGTGALKVTPAHDVNDFEIGQRNRLRMINTFDEKGRVTNAFLIDERGETISGSPAARYVWKDRFEVRRMVEEDLAEAGLLLRKEPYRLALGRCYRCQTPIEPFLTPQWFIQMKPLAEPAIQAVEEGRIKIIPPQWEKNYFEWMGNIRDWCISRQIWWGHRIPAWYCLTCDREHITPQVSPEDAPARRGAPPEPRVQGFLIRPEARPIVAREEPHACPRCGANHLVQDPDVLDTWFSSALWPFSTLGWPEKTKTLEVFYPTSCLVTGFDILFFWVARMIMMGLKFMGDVPFREVYIHALVRDAEGQKMSKSKGNVIDPLVMIDRYGADALRFTLGFLAAQGRDIRLSEERIEGYRHFCNKLWNAYRFVATHLDGLDYFGIRPEALRLGWEDRWILGRLKELIAEVTEALTAYRFNEAASALYQFLWHEYCDWYLEMVKVRLSGMGGGEEVLTGRYLLVYTLECSLRLLHPFMPFITEEIWQRLPHEGKSIMVAPWPSPDTVFSGPSEADNQIAQATVENTRALRNIRSEYNLPLSTPLPYVLMKPLFPEAEGVLAQSARYVQHLARVEVLEINAQKKVPTPVATGVTTSAEIFVPLAGVVDLDKERERKRRELERLEAEIRKRETKLANQAFLSKAPGEVIAKERKELADLKERRGKLIAHLDLLKR